MWGQNSKSKPHTYCEKLSPLFKFCQLTLRSVMHFYGFSIGNNYIGKKQTLRKPFQSSSPIFLCRFECEKLILQLKSKFQKTYSLCLEHCIADTYIRSCCEVYCLCMSQLTRHQTQKPCCEFSHSTVSVTSHFINVGPKFKI